MSLMDRRRSRWFGGAKLRQRWAFGGRRSWRSAATGRLELEGSERAHLAKSCKGGGGRPRRTFGGFGGASLKWRRGRRDTGAECWGAQLVFGEGAARFGRDWGSLLWGWGGGKAWKLGVLGAGAGNWERAGGAKLVVGGGVAGFGEGPECGAGAFKKNNCGRIWCGVS